MSQSTNQLTNDVVRLIDDFLADSISLTDIRKWLTNHPCASKSYLCSESELIILNQLTQLINQPVNVIIWQKYKDLITSLS